MSRLGASRRLFHLAILMGVLAAAAIVYKSWVPAAGLVPLVGLVILAAIEIMLPLPVAAVRQPELGDRLLKGDETEVRVVADRVFLPQNLWVEDAIPEGLDLVPGSPGPFQAAVGFRAIGTYRLTARRRGEHDFGAPVFHRTSALGLLDRSVEVPAATHFTVLPPSARNLKVRVRPRPPQREGLPTHSMRRGPGDEFFALRAYHPGDTLGDVNWKATARLQRIITNEYLPDEPPKYLIYVDTRGATVERGQEDVFERSLELAAILVEALIDARAHVGLVMLSFHSLFLVPAGGASQLRRLRQLILDTRPGAEAPIHQLILAGVPHLPGRADAVLITANVYDPTLSQAVVLLRARHGRVTVLAPAFPEPVGVGFEERSQRAAGSLLNTEQSAALASIGRYATQATQWPPEEPISVTLSRLGMSGGRRG